MTKVIDREAFAKRLRDLVLEHDMSYREMERTCGLSNGFVWRAVSNKELPGADALVLIAQELGVTVDYLLLGDMEVRKCE